MEILVSAPDRNLGSRHNFVCLRNRSKACMAQTHRIGRLVGRSKMPAVPDSAGLECQSQKYGFLCGCNKTF